MTGRMSDNPADSSLREQIESAFRNSPSLSVFWRKADALISAGLAAARADEREKIAQQLHDKRFGAAKKPDDQWFDGWCHGMAEAEFMVRSQAEFARAAGVEPKEPSDG